MKRISKLFKVLSVMIVLASVCACGKMSDPRPIEGSGYPHVYPKN